MSGQVRLEYIGGPRCGEVDYEHMVPMNECVLMGPIGKRHMGVYLPIGFEINDPETHRRPTDMIWSGERRFTHIDYGE